MWQILWHVFCYNDGCVSFSSFRVYCLTVRCWQTTRRLPWTQSSGTELTEEKRPTIHHTRTRERLQIVRDWYPTAHMCVQLNHTDTCTHDHVTHACPQVYTGVYSVHVANHLWCVWCVLLYVQRDETRMVEREHQSRIWAARTEHKVHTTCIGGLKWCCQNAYNAIYWWKVFFVQFKPVA